MLLVIIKWEIFQKPEKNKISRLEETAKLKKI